MGLARKLLTSCTANMRLSLRGFTVLVKCDRAEPLNWLRSFAWPFFDTDKIDGENWVIGYCSDAKAFQQMQTALSRYTTDTRVSLAREKRSVEHIEYFVPGMRVLHNQEFDTFCCAWPPIRELLLLSARDDSETRRYLARTVRKLTALHHQRAGAVVLHSCAFEDHDGVTLGVAGRGGGKTTFLMQNLLQGAKFVSNDRTILYQEDNCIKVCGLPNLITVRSSLLELFPQIQSSFEAVLPGTMFSAGADKSRRKLTAGEFCRLLGVPHSSSGKVKRVAFLSPEGADHKSLSPVAARALLQDAYFDYGDRPRVFFSSLYPLEITAFRHAADAVTDMLLKQSEFTQLGWNEVLAPTALKPPQSLYDYEAADAKTAAKGGK